MFLQTKMEEHIACLRKVLAEEESNYKKAIREDKPFHIVKEFFLSIKMLSMEITRMSKKVKSNTNSKAGAL